MALMNDDIPSAEYDDGYGDETDVENMRTILLEAARREWSEEDRLRFVAYRDQMRAAVTDRHPELADSLPPMDF